MNRRVVDREFSPDSVASSGDAGRRLPRAAGRDRPRFFAVAALGVCAVLVLVAAGCASKVRYIKDEADFQQQVIQAKQPILVDFFKAGCASCMFLDPVLDQLAEEYDGRVVVAKFELMRFWLEITSISLWKQYRIGLYPTVVLFVDGQEKKRWAVDYFPDNYRKVLTKIVGAPVPKKAPVESSKPPVAETAPVENDESQVAETASVDNEESPVADMAPLEDEESPDADAVPVESEASPGTS